MKELIQFLPAYFARNFGITLQGILFVLANDASFFRALSGKKRIIKGILIFLISFNTINLLAAFSYTRLAPHITTPMGDFVVAVLSTFIPMIPGLFLYRKLIDQTYSTALLGYMLFPLADCLSMMFAFSQLQRAIYTVALSILFIFLFHQEMEYLAKKHRMLHSSVYFNVGICTFMLLILAETESPRILLRGYGGITPDYENTLAFIGLLLTLAAVAFIKFDIRSIMRYEDYLHIYEDDPLTGLKKISFLVDHGPALIRPWNSRKWKPAMFFINLKRFSLYNRMYGNIKGDEALKLLAGKLQTLFPHSILCHMSDDYFFGIIPEHMAGEGMEKFRQYLLSCRGEAQTELKAGIYLLPKDITAVNFQAHYMEYLDRARMAMEWAYDQNNETVSYYNKQISGYFKRHMYVTRYINRAVEKRWLKVYYQPVIDVKTEKLLEYEALARWDDPAYGLLQPWQFIEPLEKANLIYKVDTFILAQYGRERQECMKRGEHLAPISFNLSRTDFYSCDIYSIVKDTMEQYEIPPDALHVEITESAVTRDLEQLKEAIRKFHDLGLEVWMDDFGSGYSNLNILKELDFDVIKLDMAFLRNFDCDSAIIIKNIIHMARELNIRTLAEGVETRDLFDFLQEAGCDMAQGYYFSQPIPLDKIREKEFMLP